MEERVVKGFKVGRDEVSISHLQFADDTLFLLEAELDNIKNVNCLLKFFTVCSGLKWPLKYLGLPLWGNPVSFKFWSPVIEKVSNRLDGWKKGFLSRGGRVTLIQSILASLPIYYMSIFKMPGAIVNIIEKMMRSFLWDVQGGGRNRSLVAWDLVTRSEL